MNNGYEILYHPRRLFLLFVLVFIGVASTGCKSSRNVVEETRTEYHYTGQDSARVDSMLMGGNERSSESDTTNISTDVRGSVEIKRDSVGRPIFLYWTYSGNLSAFSLRAAEAQMGFFGLNASRHSASSGTVDSVDEKKEETAQEIDTRISLRNILGFGCPELVGLFLIYMLFAKVIWPFVKQKRSR